MLLIILLSVLKMAIILESVNPIQTLTYSLWSVMTKFNSMSETEFFTGDTVQMTIIHQDQEPGN